MLASAHPAAQMRSLKENLKHSGKALERSELTEPLQLLGSNLKPPSSRPETRWWSFTVGNANDEFMSLPTAPTWSFIFWFHGSTCSSDGKHLPFLQRKKIKKITHTVTENEYLFENLWSSLFQGCAFAPMGLFSGRRNSSYRVVAVGPKGELETAGGLRIKDGCSGSSVGVPWRRRAILLMGRLRMWVSRVSVVIIFHPRWLLFERGELLTSWWTHTDSLLGYSLGCEYICVWNCAEAAVVWEIRH